MSSSTTATGCWHHITAIARRSLAGAVTNFSERFLEIIAELLSLPDDLERLNRYATPDEMESARMMLRDHIGEIAVTEEAGGVFAYTKLSSGAGYKSGAEERT